MESSLDLRGVGLTPGSLCISQYQAILSPKFTSPQELEELLGFRAVLPYIYIGETDSVLDLLLRDFMDTVFYSRNGPLISSPAVWTHLLCWHWPIAPSLEDVAWTRNQPRGQTLPADLTWPLVSLLGCPDLGFFGFIPSQNLSLCPDTEQESDYVPVLQTCSARSNPSPGMPVHPSAARLVSSL